jgi:hypothetical protein
MKANDTVAGQQRQHHLLVSNCRPSFVHVRFLPGTISDEVVLA